MTEIHLHLQKLTVVVYAWKCLYNAEFSSDRSLQFYIVSETFTNVKTETIGRFRSCTLTTLLGADMDFSLAMLSFLL